MVQETRLSVDEFVAPLFVRPGRGVRNPIGSMPGQFQFSVDTLVEHSRELAGLGVKAVILFGLPERKDPLGAESRADNGVVQQALRALRQADLGLTLITDVCLCEYTDHGHCGLVAPDPVTGQPDVDNDATLDLLAQMAVSHARAGADMVAPSDMMDGRVAAIRAALDAAGFPNLPIMAYSAKYASCFYGPFREAAESAPRFGGRATHQMDPPNGREAMREIAQDIAEGADIVMVKPALPNLDVIRAARDRFDVPIAAYNVSGEYAMIKAAAERGWLDEKRAALESLTSIRRAGASVILTYWAAQAARWLKP